LNDHSPCATCTALSPAVELEGKEGFVLPVHSGHVHSIESAGMVDGPGVRYVVILSGCPLRCLYCHNPDTQKLKTGKVRTAREILADIATLKPFLSGGVTITGGEPLVQAGFTKTLLRGARDLGLPTAVDTSGYLGHKADEEIRDLTDLWLLDIKSYLPETYRKVTGVDVEPTLNFARLLSAENRKLWIRFVIVPGLTDAPDNIAGVAQFVARLGRSVQRVEVLPFHKMGEYKWRALDMPYQLFDTPTPSPETVESVKNIFRSHGITAP
jgi:pyruvate formate lyase activating enzyme